MYLTVSVVPAVQMASSLSPLDPQQMDFRMKLHAVI